MKNIQSNLNGLLIFILSGILLSAFGVQIFLHEQPCPLCLLQRLCMLGVAAGALLNMQFGLRMSHYAVILISSVVGGFVALRQISLHVCPGDPTFGLPVLGLSLYTWSFLVFVSTVLYVALLLFLYEFLQKEEPPLLKLNIWNKTAFALIFAITVANFIGVLLQCGFGPCADV